MDSNFRRLMDDATRLTGRGELDAATRAIQTALGHYPTRTGSSSTGIDGDEQGADDRQSSIIDGECERVDQGSSRMHATANARARKGTADKRSAGPPLDSSHGIVVRGRQSGAPGVLDYRLFVPPAARTSRQPALVVMLHGCTQNADDFALGTRMDELACERGVYVLYPEQSERANPQRCWNWFKHNHQCRDSGEPAAILAAIEHVITTHDIDRARVFVAGLSAGGAMAANLGSLFPERFAAVGVHSGLAAGSARDLPSALAAMRGDHSAGASTNSSHWPGMASSTSSMASNQLPTIVFHGDRDSTVHPRNGERIFSDCHACASVANQTRLTGREGNLDWSRRICRDAEGHAIAEHWLVHGAAHSWSGGDPRGSHTSASGPDASREMLRFFLERCTNDSTSPDRSPGDSDGS